MRQSSSGGRRWSLAALLVAAAGVAAIVVPATQSSARSPRQRTVAVVPSKSPSSLSAKVNIRHVFVIVLENEDESTSFGSGSPAPYLAQTLVSKGAYVPNYYGIGHHSLDNYIAMISGQAPDAQTEGDCPVFADFTPDMIGADGQAEGSGCVYPANVPTIASQLTAAGDTWRSYNEDMGADPARESATCGHPTLNQPDMTEVATPTDMYASRHDPFVYFHAIIDDGALCTSHVVNLSALPSDLAKLSATADYSFITPDLCDDGHDSPCANGDPGGLTQANTWLQTWVPKITSSAAFRQDGLLIVTFDESAGADATSCCGEIAGPNSALPGGTGPGGGQVGAVMLSPCITPGTVTETAYNHYTMLGSVENLFGLPHLGYAGLPNETYFGSDIFKGQCGPAPPTATVKARIAPVRSSRRVKLTVRWSASTAGGTALASFQVQERTGGTWRTLDKATTKTSLTASGSVGIQYRFRVRATNLAGQVGAWAGVTAGSAT